MVFITRIPTHYNDGTPVPKGVVQQITDWAYELFRGWSMDPPTAGGWMDDEGNRYTEQSQRLQISCTRGQYLAARDFVIRIGRLLGQKAMYFEVRDFDGAEIIEVPPAAKRRSKRKR